MTETDAPPNELCAETTRVSPRRRVCIFLALLVLAVLGWIGWEQWQLIQRQAAAPVVSVAEDGTVRINGVEIVIGADGLPPKVLEEVLGGPPVEERSLLLPLLSDEPPPGAFRQSARIWRYSGRSMILGISRRIIDGKVWYRSGLIYEGTGSDAGCTLKFRGMTWWLGIRGLRGALTPDDFQPCIKPEEESRAGIRYWALKEGDTGLNLAFRSYRPFDRLDLDLLSHDVLDRVTVAFPDVMGGAAADRGVGTPEERW